MCCWSLLTSHVSSSKGRSAVGPLMPHHMDLCFRNSPQLIPRMEGNSGWGDKRRREGSGEGNGEWMLVWWEDQTHCNAKNIHSILHTQSPASQPPFPRPLCSAREGQTSTDWIWFICARIIWTLLRIFFWWPANVTPTPRMSLWRQTGADVRLMISQTTKSCRIDLHNKAT